MRGRTDRAPPPDPVRNRCRCGHFPTTHLLVAPIAAGSGFLLEPTGPCAICRESVCPKFAPAV
ncbi:MAG TPA: hypothetical protein VN864_06620 [Thermoplasmata archaeon]|nr:hypothetical protein [Thermoplasmata archaeon]